MENEILESIKHIKNISKKKVTVEKIFTNIKKKNLIITYEDLQHILDKMVIDNILYESGSGVSRTYLTPEDPDKIFVPDMQDISSNSNNNLLTENIILGETNLEQSAQKVTNVNHDNLLNEIKSFKNFRRKSRVDSVYWRIQVLQEKRPKKLRMIHRDL